MHPREINTIVKASQVSPDLIMKSPLILERTISKKRSRSDYKE